MPSSWGVTLRQQPQQMRVLGTSLPRAQTVHERVFGPAPRGRPVVIKPKNLALKSDKSRPEAYRLLWQKIKPDAIQRAEGLMGIHMPPALESASLRAYNAKKHRREH
jgi:hypothetical protein